jgi:branched-chain amino acid transport system substrate-binding protein
LRAIGAGTVAGLAGLSGCVGRLPGLGKEPVQLGSIFPSTGSLSEYGLGMEAAVELAVEHVNSAGGPRGRTVELHQSDSGTDVETALNSYETMAADHDVVGFVGAAASHVSAPLAERAAGDGVM